MKKTKLSQYLAETGLSLNRSTQIRQGFKAQQNDVISLAGRQMYEPSADELKMEQDLQTETDKMLSENQAWVDGLQTEQPQNKTGRFNEWANSLIPLVAGLVRPGKIDDNTDYLQLANTPAPNGTGSQALMKKGGKIKANEGIPILPGEDKPKMIKQQTDPKLYGYDLLNMAIAEGRNPKDIVLNPQKGTSSRATYLDQINNALGEEQGRLAYTAASIFAQQEGVDKMSKEERIKAFYGGISANPKLNELKERVGAYNGTRSALSLFETSPLMLPSDYAQNTQKQNFEEGGTVEEGPGDPKPKIFKTKEEREQARINFEKVAKKALSTPNDEDYLYKFGSVYDPQKKREITQDDSQQCINGICGLYEASGINYNAGGFGKSKRYIGNGSFFDNVIGKKEDIYMTTSPKAMDHLQYTSTRQTKDGKIIKYPTHSKAIYAVENGDLKVIHNGGGKEFYEETLDINDVKNKIKNGDIIAYRYGREIDKEDLEKEKKASMSPEVMAGLEKQKLEKKKKELKNQTYRKLLADNPNTVMEQIDNFNNYSIDEKKINRNKSLIDNNISIKDLAIKVDDGFFEKGVGKHLLSTLNDESKVLDISEKYGISPFEASKLLRQAMGVAITESRGGKPTGASAIKYGIEEMMPETIQRKLSVGPYQIRYNSLNKQQREKLGNSKSLYTEESSTETLLDLLMENKKYIDNRIKQKRTKDMPGLTEENAWDYAPMLMNQLNKGKVNDTGFKYNTRAGQIKYIADNLLINTGSIKDRTKKISNGKK